MQLSNFGGQLPQLSATGIVNSILSRARLKLGTLPGMGVGLGVGGGGGGGKTKKDKEEPPPKQQPAGYDPSYDDAAASQGTAPPQRNLSQSQPTPPDQPAGGAGAAQKAQDEADDAESDNAPDQLAASIQNAGDQQGAIPTDDTVASNGGDTLGLTDNNYAEGGAIPSYDGGGPATPAAEPEYDDEDQSTPPIQVASSQQGAIPDDSGAAPVAATPADNSGALPVAGPQDQAQAAPQQGGVPTSDAQLPLVAWLHGAGAATRDAVLQAAQAITPGMDTAMGGIPENPNQPAPQAPAPQQGQVPKLPADAAQTAATVAKTQGEDAAAAHLQRMRIEYQHGMALATTALNAGHKDVAAQMATNAYTWLPDGVTASFTPTQNGMIAHIMGPDGKAQDYPLSDQSFNELIHIGKAAQFDNILHKGGIGQIAATLSARDAATPAGRPQQSQGQEEGEDGVPGPKQRSKVITILPGPNNHGAKPSYQLIGGAAAQPPAAGDSVETRAMRRSYGGPAEQATQDYMDKEQQFEAGLKNKTDVATAHGKSMEAAANIRAKASVENNKNTVQGRLQANQNTNFTRQQIATMTSADRQALLQHKISEAHRLASQNDLTNARAAIDTAIVAGGGLKSLSPEHQALYNYIVSRANNPGQAAQQRPTPAAAPQPQQAAAQTQKPATTQQPPVQGARLYNGQWYTRGQNGEAVPVRQ